MTLIVTFPTVEDNLSFLFFLHTYDNDDMDGQKYSFTLEYPKSNTLPQHLLKKG